LRVMTAGQFQFCPDALATTQDTTHLEFPFVIICFTFIWENLKPLFSLLND